MVRDQTWVLECGLCYAPLSSKSAASKLRHRFLRGGTLENHPGLVANSRCQDASEDSLFAFQNLRTIRLTRVDALNGPNGLIFLRPFLIQLMEVRYFVRCLLYQRLHTSGWCDTWRRVLHHGPYWRTYRRSLTWTVISTGDWSSLQPLSFSHFVVHLWCSKAFALLPALNTTTAIQGPLL